MRWFVFAIAAFIMLSLDQGLRVLLRIPGSDGVAPSFMLVLAVFVMISAPRRTAFWAALTCGLLVDLSLPRSAGQATDFALIGPMALGYLAGAAVTVELRGLIFRDSPVAFGALVLIAGTFVHLVAVALLTLRGLPYPAFIDAINGWSAADELVRRFFELLYSAVLAVPLGLLLIWSDRFWAFGPQTTGPSSRARRLS
ncbi:MAG: hypothetical protein CMJ18_03280 [Phycisphaeraceae bacterium]|nr:hypothetical protein [Phycisphaeraceae bacterium]